MVLMRGASTSGPAASARTTEVSPKSPADLRYATGPMDSFTILSYPMQKTNRIYATYAIQSRIYILLCRVAALQCFHDVPDEIIEDVIERYQVFAPERFLQCNTSHQATYGCLQSPVRFLPETEQ